MPSSWHSYVVRQAFHHVRPSRPTSLISRPALIPACSDPRFKVVSDVAARREAARKDFEKRFFGVYEGEAGMCNVRYLESG
jgi:hypothetical protein